MIRVPQIRLIGAEGEQLGIMTPDEARDLAAEAGLDLVEVAARANPPVCRIMDYGKFKYEQSKKASQSKATRVEVKTITMRQKTDSHDLETKINQARKFLEKGDRVKFVMRLRGREHAHKDLWYQKMGDVLAGLQDVAAVTRALKMRDAPSPPRSSPSAQADPVRRRGAARSEGGRDPSERRAYGTSVITVSSLHVSGETTADRSAVSGVVNSRVSALLRRSK